MSLSRGEAAGCWGWAGLGWGALGIPRQYLAAGYADREQENWAQLMLTHTQLCSQGTGLCSICGQFTDVFFGATLGNRGCGPLFTCNFFFFQRNIILLFLGVSHI